MVYVNHTVDYVILSVNYVNHTVDLIFESHLIIFPSRYKFFCLACIMRFFVQTENAPEVGAFLLLFRAFSERGGSDGSGEGEVAGGGVGDVEHSHIAIVGLIHGFQLGIQLEELLLHCQ